MIFRKIELSQYRNFKNLAVNFSPKLNIFIGKNGQGKTNLLEAIHVIIRGHSFRYSDNKVLTCDGYQEAFIKAEIQEKDLFSEIKLQISKTSKKYIFNNKKITSAELSSKFPIIIFSPESISIIKESAEQRRLLIDDFLIMKDKNNGLIITDYRKAHKTRNKILRDYQQGLTKENETKNLLASITPIFLVLATELTYKRISALKEIEPLVNNAMNYINKKQNVEIAVEYVISGQNMIADKKETINEAMHKRLNELNRAELSYGSSLIGPHKHDITFLYNQKDSRFFCSQGQQRALILSFKIAQIVYHIRVHKIEPVLLLDDVLSELDLEKRSSLIEFLNESNSQILITTTDLSLTKELNNQQLAIFKMVDGKIEERPLL